jgi:hypothetical protein
MYEEVFGFACGGCPRFGCKLPEEINGAGYRLYLQKHDRYFRDWV